MPNPIDLDPDAVERQTAKENNPTSPAEYERMMRAEIARIVSVPPIYPIYPEISEIAPGEIEKTTTSISTLPAPTPPPPFQTQPNLLQPTQTSWKPLTEADVRAKREKIEQEETKLATNKRSSFVSNLVSKARKSAHTPKGRQSRQVNFLFPSSEAFEQFTEACRELRVTKADVITALVMDFLREFDEDALEKMKEAGAWERQSAGRPRDTRGEESEAGAEGDLGSEVANMALPRTKSGKKLAPSQPIICGIKFPKIPPLDENSWSAYPVGNVRHLTEEEYKQFKNEAIKKQNIELLKARFVDEANNVFNAATEVLSNGGWWPTGQTNTTYPALMKGLWTPTEYDWRVQEYLDSRAGNTAKKQANIRHLFEGLED